MQDVATARGDSISVSEIAGSINDRNLKSLSEIPPPNINLDNGASLAKKTLDKLRGAKEQTVSFLKDVYDGDNRDG
jgi:hypothetical protein